jgi:hypothetical protein
MPSPREIGRTAARGLVAAALGLATSMGVAGAEERIAKYLVQVRLPAPEAAADLESAGFDVAGVNRKDLTAGVVVTDDEMKRLRDLGWSFTVSSSNDDASIQALSDYTDPQELSTFEDQVVAAHPDLAQKSTVADTLFEGQRIYAVKITKDVGQDNGRPTFVLDCQHHAREVMTAEICRDAIDYLTSRYATDTQVQRWVDAINIYVVGSANPDGSMYVFTTDPMWRKNRHPACAVDVNRNYSFAWGSCNGSSALCSDETFRGTEPSSEPETRGMIGLYSSVHAFYALSYHTYGEYIMFPYGCQNPDELTAMNEVAHNLNDILQNDNGQTGQYATGPIWNTIYLVDGGSVDMSYAQFETYAYTIEANCCSFQPDYATWRNVTVQRQRTAWQFFLNRTLDGPQIRGTVTDGYSGAPLAAGVAVQEITYTHGEAPRRADAKGHYAWLARSGQAYHVTFTKPGYCTVTDAVTVGSGPATLDRTLVQPTPPSTVNAAGAGDNAIDVSWSAAVNAVQYRVLRSLTSGGPYVEVGLVGAPQVTFHDTAVSGQVPYYYVVHALQPCESGNSSQAAAQTTGACTVGPAFGGIAAVANAGSPTCTLELSWIPASTRCGGQVTYSVYRGASWPFTPSSSNLIASGLQGATYTDHDALTNGASTTYVVRATDAGNGVDDGNLVAAGAAPTGPSSNGTWTDDAGDAAPATLTPSPPWTVQPTGGKSGPKVYATGTYANNTCSALTSPAISVQASSALSFASKYDIETGWDAGIVEIAPGPAYSAWTRLATVNYPDALSNTGNACGFPKSFTGTVFSHSSVSPSYAASGYAGGLSAYAGQDVKLRWRLSSDSTTSGAGWWVDDIAVTNAVFRQACTSGSAASPAEPGAAASPMTASRAASGTGVDLAYGPACGTIDNAVYWGEGPISGAVAWTHTACALGNTGRASFDPGIPPPGGMDYFVIVGQSAAREGSYGRSFDGLADHERPEAIGIGTCDLPQDLSGSCP